MAWAAVGMRNCNSVVGGCNLVAASDFVSSLPQSRFST